MKPYCQHYSGVSRNAEADENCPDLLWSSVTSESAPVLVVAGEEHRVRNDSPRHVAVDGEI